jgi:hypothetical protein
MQDANLESDLRNLLSKLKVEIGNDQSEIETRKKRIEKNEVLLRAVRASLEAIHPEKKTTGYGSKSEIIWSAIQRINKPQFTQDDVEGEIMRVNPEMEIKRPRIRSALWILVNKYKRIKQVGRGNNRQPAIYEKSDTVFRQRRVTERDKDLTLKGAT